MTVQTARAQQLTGGTCKSGLGQRMPSKIEVIFSFDSDGDSRGCLPPGFLKQNKHNMILTYPDILDSLNRGDIVIEPLDPARVGTNSIDLTLGKYVVKLDGRQPLDLKKPTDISIAEIPDEGYLLVPGLVYLCATAERTWTKKHVPILHGKSSIARMGISVHDAGFGDLGFKGHWTLELTVAQPVTIYTGTPIVQIAFHEPKSMPDLDYMNLKTSSYTQAWEDPKPQPSALWKKLQGNKASS